MEHERPTPDSFIQDPEEARELAEAERPFRDVLSEIRTINQSHRGLGDDPVWAAWYENHSQQLETMAGVSSDNRQIIQEMRPLLFQGTLGTEMQRLRNEAHALSPYIEALTATFRDNPKGDEKAEPSPIEERFINLHTRIAISEMLLRAQQHVREIQERGMLDELLRVFPRSIRIRQGELEDECAREVNEAVSGSYKQAYIQAAFIDELEAMLWIAQKIKESEE